MITGQMKPADFEEEDGSWYFTAYQYQLDKFEGLLAPGSGIYEEIYGARMLVAATGSMVLIAENDLKAYGPMYPNEPYDDLPDVAYNSTFRQATLKTLLSYSQSILEGGLHRLYVLLRNEGKITKKPEEYLTFNKLVEKFDGFGNLQESWDLIRQFIFLRNAVLHNMGQFKSDRNNADKFVAFAEAREDLTLRELEKEGDVIVYLVIINKSTVIIEFLDVISQLFRDLLNAASKK